MTYKHRRRTIYEREQLYQKVQTLLDKGLSMKQIAREIGVPQSTTGRYISTVTKRQKQKWQDSSQDSLEKRVFEIKDLYERGSEICREIMNDPKKSSKDRLDAFKLCISAKNNIYNMMSSGALKVQSKINTNSKKPLEDKNEE